MSTKALVLNSGGVDSTTVLSMALQNHTPENVATLSVYYGQRHEKELECAKKIAEYYKVSHYEVNLSSVYQFSNSSLLASSDVDIPEKSYDDQLKEAHDNNEKILSTVIPFRNGVLLSCVAALAMSIFPNEQVDIYYGAHLGDAEGNAYADCTVEFTEAMTKAINLGSYGNINIVAPIVNMTKAEVVKKGLELGTPYNLTTSCYEGREKACGKCGTCLQRLEAFKANGVEDPIEYEDNDVKKLN